jgi:hypothetical protein
MSLSFTSNTRHLNQTSKTSIAFVLIDYYQTIGMDYKITIPEEKIQIEFMKGYCLS